MRKNQARLGLVGFCAYALFIPAAFAAQIVVHDCDGAIRAIGDSGETTNSNVVIELAAQEQNSYTGVPVTLTNGIETRSAFSNDEGQLSFEKIAAGKWTACVGKANVNLADVSIVKANPETTIGPIALLGAGIAGVGGIALGGLSGSERATSEIQGSPSALAGTGQNSNLLDNSAPSREVAAARSKGSLKAQDDCKTNALPDTLSPFL